jgi:hypothetical protein
MSRRAARCTQADIARALSAAKQAGVSMAVEIDPDGTIRLTPAPGAAEAEKVGVFDPKRRIVL